MKFHLTTAALAIVLAMKGVSADELKASAIASKDKGPGIVASMPAVGGASAPAAKPRGVSASEPARKPARKVATDYAPAQDLLFSAMSLIGVKYKWGGNTPESGLDCSGFVRYVFQNSLNIVLPRTSFNMSQMGETVDKEELKPGDLVFFNTLKRQFSHVGIYLGDNRFIHSPRKGRSVEVANMAEGYWTKRFNGARRMSELDHETVDISALLQGRPARQSVASTASSGSSCRKVTRVKNGKKQVTTVCSASRDLKAGKKRNGKASAAAEDSKPAGKKAATKKTAKKKTKRN